MKNRLTESETAGIVRLWKKYRGTAIPSATLIAHTPSYLGKVQIIIENRIGNTTFKSDWEIAIAIRPHPGTIKDTTYYYSNTELPADIRTALRIAYDIEFTLK